MEQKSAIAVLGCGYVGLTAAAILANCGYKVFALEPNPKRLEIIKQGRSFFYDVGLDPLIKSGMESGNFVATDSYETSIPESDIVFSCVGTPDNPDGSSNLSYVFESAEKTAALIKPSTVFVQKSTVPVGTGDKLEKLFAAAGKQVPYVSNPEFLREGTAIADSLWFDRTVVGSNDKVAAEKVMALYRDIEQQRETLAKIAGIENPGNIQSQYITTARNSAELIKVSANAFLAMKISFANSIAKLADQANADVVEVMDAVGADRRIGRAFLNAGRGYGGGCFPKDVSGLIRSAEEYGVDMEIMQAATEVNDSMPHYIITKAEKALGGSFEGKNVAVLGLAFKAGTSDTRRSPAIVIANTLASKGANTRTYDPEAMEEAKEDLNEKIALCESLDSAIRGVDCIFIAADWPEFKQFDWSRIQAKLLVDGMNNLDRSKLPAGITYIGVGKA